MAFKIWLKMRTEDLLRLKFVQSFNIVESLLLGILIQNRNQSHLLFAIVLIVCDCIVNPDPKFLTFKTKKTSSLFSEVGGWLFWSYVITQDIFNTFIEINFCFRCMVWPWLRLVATLNIRQILRRYICLCLSFFFQICTYLWPWI